MKRTLCLLVSLLTALTCLTACSAGTSAQPDGSAPPSGSQSETASPGDATEASQEISFWTLTSYQDAAEQVLDLFQKEHPEITVNVTLNGGDPHKNNLMVAAASNTMPDIWFNWGGTLATFYSDNGLTYDLSAYAQAHNWEERFIPSTLELATFDGEIVGYPVNFNILEVFYRKDIFEQAGATVPTTFAEFEDALAKIKAIGVTPLAMGGKSPSDVMRTVEALIEHYAGAEEHDKLNALKTSWDTESVVNAFTKYKEWVDKGYMPTGFLTLESTENKMLLYAGAAAMSIDGASGNSNLYKDEQDPSLYGYFKFPQDEGGQRVSSFIEMIQFNSALSDEKFDAAMTFVEYYYAPETVKATGTLIKQPLPLVDNELPEQLSMVPALIDDMDTYGSYTITDQALPQVVCDALFQAQDKVAAGTMTPQEAAAFIEQSAAEYKASNP